MQPVWVVVSTESLHSYPAVSGKQLDYVLYNGACGCLKPEGLQQHDNVSHWATVWTQIVEQDINGGCFKMSSLLQLVHFHVRDPAFEPLVALDDDDYYYY